MFLRWLIWDETQAHLAINHGWNQSGFSEWCLIGLSFHEIDLEWTLFDLGRQQLLPIWRIIVRCRARIKFNTANGKKDVLDLARAKAGDTHRLSGHVQANGTRNLWEHANRFRITRDNSKSAGGRVGSECNASVASGESGNKEKSGGNSQDPTTVANRSNSFG